MNNQAYLRALEKALDPLPRQERDNIMNEIRSHVDAAGQISLQERFGSPDTLAQHYLEDNEAIKPGYVTGSERKTGAMGKKILAFVGVSVLLLALLLTGVAYWFSLDEFDYANEDAPQLHDDSRRWLTTAAGDAPQLKVEQAKVVFYWHDTSSLRWSCQGQDELNKNEQGQFVLRQSRCLVYLPKKPVQIQSNQAALVMVRPQADVNLDLWQSQLRMAEKGAAYRYDVESQRSRLSGYQADPEADVAIEIKAFESDLGRYE